MREHHGVRAVMPGEQLAAAFVCTRPGSVAEQRTSISCGVPVGRWFREIVVIANSDLHCRRGIAARHSGLRLTRNVLSTLTPFQTHDVDEFWNFRDVSAGVCDQGGRSRRSRSPLSCRPPDGCRRRGERTDTGRQHAGQRDPARQHTRRSRAVAVVEVRATRPDTAAPGPVQQLGKVDGLPPTAVQLVDLGAAAEAVGEDHGVAGRPRAGPGAGPAPRRRSLTSRWPASNPKLPASPQHPESSRSASARRRRSSSCGRRPSRAPRAGGSAPGRARARRRATAASSRACARSAARPA